MGYGIESIDVMRCFTRSSRLAGSHCGLFAELLVAIALLATGRTAWALEPATSPRVVATTPTLEARFADPALEKLVVRFDQPMHRTSWSWCGGGPLYPEITGKPYFEDDTTCVLPVRLEPERTYQLWINCPGYEGFRSRAGNLPAESQPFRFTTTWSPGMLAQADALNPKTFDRFREIVLMRYSHLERTGTDWETVLDESRPWMLAAPNPEEWARRAARVLAPANDPHLKFRLLDGSSIPTHSRHARFNGNDRILEKRFPQLERLDNDIWYGDRDGTGYLAVNNWSLSNSRLERLDIIMAEMVAGTRALILDVRRNGGGDETQARRLAGWFLDEPVLYARHAMRDPKEPGGWKPEGERWVQANRPEQRYSGPVYVLQGQVCLSSNEAFLLMMRECPHATLIGEPSGGSSANPRAFPLPNGILFVVPRWRSLLPDGSELEGYGVPPDVRVDGDFLNADPVLETALRLARETLHSGETNEEPNDP